MSKIKKPGAFAPLIKKAKRGMRGYPLATVAFYGPDDKRASKCVASIQTGEPVADDEDFDAPMQKWFSDTADLRHDAATAAQVAAFIGAGGAKTVVVSGIIGCPHEENIDYQGETCPQCPFWHGRDRWTGQMSS